MKAPIGSFIRIYVDLVAPVAVGDVVETGTGRRYAVLSVDVQARGKHAGRQHLGCMVTANNTPPRRADGVVHVIRWYKRG